MSDQVDSSNGRVTLARLGDKVDNLTSLVREWREEDRATHRDHEGRIRCLEERATRADEQLKTRTGLLAGLSVLVSAAATAIGSAFK